MRNPYPIFVSLWAFWWLGCPIYTYGLVTGMEWATPAGAFTWLVAFGWFEMIPLMIGRAENSLSGVVAWLIWLPSRGEDAAWLWLADAIALPIAVLIAYTFVALFGGLVGWALGLGWAGYLILLLHRHWRYMVETR